MLHEDALNTDNLLVTSTTVAGKDALVVVIAHGNYKDQEAGTLVLLEQDAAMATKMTKKPTAITSKPTQKTGRHDDPRSRSTMMHRGASRIHLFDSHKYARDHDAVWSNDPTPVFCQELGVSQAKFLDGTRFFSACRIDCQDVTDSEGSVK